MSDMDTSRIDALSVLQGWDLVDSIRASNDQAIERWRLKSEIDAPQPTPSRKPRRFSATRLAKNKELIVSTESKVPAEDRLMRLRVTDIEEFEFNPRKFVGENYLDLKESIRTSGIEATISVTKIPGRERYTIAAGGNSRLRAVQELFSESNDPKFEFITCRVLVFTDLRSLKFAHVRENNHRSDMCFWDKANAALDLLQEFEKTEGRKAKNEEAVEYLLQGDRSVSVTMLNLYRFAIDNLSALGTSVQSLSSKDVQNVFRPEISSASKLGQLFEIEPLKMRREVVDPVLELLSLRYEELRTFDVQFFPSALREAFARLVGMSRQEIDRAAELQQRMAGLTLDVLLPLLRQQPSGSDPMRSQTLRTPQPNAFVVASRDTHDTTHIRAANSHITPLAMGSDHHECVADRDTTAADVRTHFPRSPSDPMASTDSEALIAYARDLVEVYFEGDVSIIECPALPYGFIVELPNILDDGRSSLKHSALWWYLSVVTEQSSLKGMQVLPPSEFAECCLQDEDWATKWKAKLAPSTSPEHFADICQYMLRGDSKGNALWQFMQSARSFRENHPERFCADFWVQQGVAV